MTLDGLQAKLVEKESKSAKIEIEGQIIEISEKYLPLNIKSGQTMRLYFLDSADGILEEKKLAKAILEEILNGK